MCKVKMFGVWLRGDSNATFQKLAKALTTVGKRNIAEAVCTARGMVVCFVQFLISTVVCMLQNRQG